MSTATPDTGTDTDTTTDTNTTTDAPDTGPDLEAELAKWKAAARKHEERAKANATAARELETLKQQSMSDTEKAVAAARTEGRAEALRELAVTRVEDAVRVAAAGRPVDIEALLEVLDATRFVTDDGEPDRKAITAWIDRIAPQRADDDTVRPLDLGQGVRGNSSMALNGDPLLRDLKQKLGVR